MMLAYLVEVDRLTNLIEHSPVLSNKLQLSKAVAGYGTLLEANAQQLDSLPIEVNLFLYKSLFNKMVYLKFKIEIQ